jgi:hypothetical protein
MHPLHPSVGYLQRPPVCYSLQVWSPWCAPTSWGRLAALAECHALTCMAAPALRGLALAPGGGVGRRARAQGLVQAQCLADAGPAGITAAMSRRNEVL